VLGVTPLTDRGGGYYLGDLAAELGPLCVADRRGTGFARTTGAPGRWVGAGAEGLGLRGPVRADDLGLVLSGGGPVTGRRLAGRVPTVSAYDLTFSAPKSVSVLMALGAPDVSAVVLGSHEVAVHGALGYVAEHAAAVRRAHGTGREVLAVRGIVGAAFTHGVSRALDPHLHSHVLVANLAQGSDGRWSALDARGLFAHARAAGVLYEGHLRRALTSALGIDWTTRGTSHEVAGMDPVVLGGFSQRAAEIRAHLAGRSVRSRRAGRVAWAATRDPKTPSLTAPGIARLWADRAARLGVGPGALDAVLGHRAGHDPSLDEHRFGTALMAGGPAAIARRDVVGAWAGALGGGATVEDVERCVDQFVPIGPVGVAEPALAPARVTAPPATLRALGPRPASPGPLALWHRAARSIDHYRDRWGEFASTGGPGPGGRPVALHRAPPAQVAEHLAVARSVREARRALGREPVRVEREVLALGRG